LIQTALHGAGLQLGVAEEAAETILFQEAINGNGVKALLSMLKEGLAANERVSVVHSDDIILGLDAHNATALVDAAAALDMACSRALSNEIGLGAAVVLNASHTDLLNEMTIRCAERGLLGLLLWHTVTGSGFALAGPSTSDSWFIDSRLPAAAPLYHELSAMVGGQHDKRIATLDKLKAQLAFNQPESEKGIEENIVRSLTQCILDHSGSATTPGTSATLPPGYVLVCMQIDAPLAGRIFNPMSKWQQLRTDPGAAKVRTLDPLGMQEQKIQWQTHGLRISKDDFSALSNAARKWLVPDSEEFSLRPGERIDPLKIF
jgi:hypothetical protein